MLLSDSLVIIALSDHTVIASFDTDLDIAEQLVVVAACSLQALPLLGANIGSPDTVWATPGKAVIRFKLLIEIKRAQRCTFFRFDLSFDLFTSDAIPDDLLHNQSPISWVKLLYGKSETKAVQVNFLVHRLLGLCHVLDGVS